MRELTFDAEVIVFLSPHSPVTGVYAELVGDLSAFGVPEVAVRAETSGEIRDGLGLDVIDGPIDHGILVPLLLRKWDVPVVGTGIAGNVTIDLDVAARVMVVASINLSAGLSARAPLTQLPGASDVEARFLRHLERDVATASADELEGSCGRHVMQTFGRIFSGRATRVLAHEAPVGVGYLVAEVR